MARGSVSVPVLLIRAAVHCSTTSALRTDGLSLTGLQHSSVKRTTLLSERGFNHVRHSPFTSEFLSMLYTGYFSSESVHLASLSVVDTRSI